MCVRIETVRGNVMRIAICDDEKSLRRDLRRLVEVHLELQGMDYEIEEYTSGETLVRDMGKNETDILFLDIEMPGIGGMDTARALRSAGDKVLIIFVTAYPDYVFQGYEVQAFHYILKPYQPRKIQEVLDKAIEERGASREHYYVVEQKSGTLRLRLSQIYCFYSDRRSVCALDKNGDKVTFYGKLDRVQEELPSFFQRVHNRYLVNMNEVSKVEGGCCVCNGEEIPVSRTYRQSLAVAFAQILLK